jgi:hypothetical protein
MCIRFRFGSRPSDSALTTPLPMRARYTSALQMRYFISIFVTSTLKDVSYGDLP